MTIKAGDWQTLWDRMGNSMPCPSWRRYIERFSTVTEVLAAVRARRVIGEGAGTASRFDPYWKENDVQDSRHFLERLTGRRNPTDEQVLAALAKYEDPS